MTVNANDDWRPEVVNHLNTSVFYNELISRQGANSAVGSLITIINDSCYYAYQRTKVIIRYMEQYTLHDGDHLFRVLKLMEKIVPVEEVKELGNLELALLILSAFFHDIGMAPDSNEVEIWLGRISSNDMTPEQRQQKFKYEKYCSTSPSLQRRVNRNIATGNHQQVVLLEKHQLSEWIRKTHADRAREIVNSQRADFKYKDCNFASILGEICVSHNENPYSLLREDNNINPNLLISNGEYVNVPYIAIILRLADILDFDSKRTPKVLFDHIGVKNPISLAEWQKHRSIDGWNISSEQITFSATCDHPAIERSIKDFCNYIEQEIASCHGVLRELNYTYDRRHLREKYNINVSAPVKPQIRIAEDDFGKPKYHYIDAYFKLNQSEIIELLMGTNLYGDTSFALRELIQNSLDTCRFRSIKENDWGNLYRPQISIRFNREDSVDILEIEDNGMGMDEDIIKKYFSNVGSSYYRSDEFYQDMAIASNSFTPISKFGIGFLSAFMVSDSIEVDTVRKTDRYQISEQPLNIEIEGESGIFLAKIGSREHPGTKIKLYLKEGHPFGYPNEKQADSRLLKILNEVIRYNSTEIVVETDEFIVNYDSYGEEIEVFITEDIAEYTKEIQLPLDGLIDGLSGTLKCIFLFDDKVIKEIKMPKKTYTDENGQITEYSRSFICEMGSINEVTNFVTTTTKKSISSRGYLTMGGISISDKLFVNNSEKINNDNNLGTFIWPFPVIYDIKLSNEVVINLTASRNNIIIDDKWSEFKDILCKVVAIRLIETIEDESIIGSLIQLVSNGIEAEELKRHLILQYGEYASKTAKERIGGSPI
ncbi:ATP-binding protein [Cohnella sp. WQ 127256]|uniref:HD domain-containing protein n=1 Tax=Cohnella sp. WQ 127256 TaxID=2938790 RepID=UPI0021186F17|nr:ATP-binding protein [Cohnella sp. WQ 127256]